MEYVPIEIDNIKEEQNILLKIIEYFREKDKELINNKKGKLINKLNNKNMLNLKLNESEKHYNNKNLNYYT